jgi:glycosyltransferase involved in cell wall biosynthesis
MSTTATKVAYLVTRYPARSHTFIRREIDVLRSLGVLVDVYAVRGAGPGDVLTDREADDERTTWHAVPPPPRRLVRAHFDALRRRPGAYLRTLGAAWRHRNPSVRAALWSVFHFLEAIDLAVELERRDTDHLHVHFATSSGQVGYLVHRFLGIPWSLTLHGSCDFEHPAGTLLGPKIAAASFVRCVSHYGRSQALRTVPPQEWAKVFVAHTGLDLASMPPMRRVPPPQPAQVCSIGRLSSEKGQAGLLEAFARCRDEGLDAELVLVGDGEDRGMIEDRVRDLGLAARCRLTGVLPEHAVITQLLTTTVLALPSLMEGLPVVLMEAMALGVPVVAPRVAGIPELVEHERTGLLFDPADWDGLADGIMRLARDPTLAASLAAAARVTVEERFDITTSVLPLAARFGVDVDTAPDATVDAIPVTVNGHKPERAHAPRSRGRRRLPIS